MDDHERPLNGRGTGDAPRMGRLLRCEDLTPGLILCSSAVRARQTVELVIEAGGLNGELQIRDELYLASPRTYLALLLETAEAHETVMVVGHNPGLQELLNELTGNHLRMPTAALAQITPCSGYQPAPLNASERFHPCADTCRVRFVRVTWQAEV